MPGAAPLQSVIHKMLQDSDLRFRDFVEVALYYPGLGYYARHASPVGTAGDYVTSPSISPVFGYSIDRLIHELLSRTGGGVCSVVDIGCGDGTLINTLWSEDPRLRFFGVDRSLDRASSAKVTFARDLSEVERNDFQIVVANELFDALPFARVVQRGDDLHELWVTERDGQLEWSEHEAAADLLDYFRERGITLEDGQFADVSPDWKETYAAVARWLVAGLIVTFDYGLPQEKLFRSRVRRFGTAAAYSKQRVSRDLLANPGEQDLTAHINFTDLERAGEEEGLRTLFFDRQAKFLLSLGAHEHDLLRPDDAVDSLELREAREQAKRLILPDGIGEDIRVLVQGKGVPLDGWSFQRKLY